jgi:hypothetical protein
LGRVERKTGLVWEWWQQVAPSLLPPSGATGPARLLALAVSTRGTSPLRAADQNC